MKQITSSAQWNEWRRNQALELRDQDRSDREISEALEVNTVTVSQWMTKVIVANRVGPAARPHPCSPAKLSQSQLQMLREYLTQGAEAYGFRGEIWTSR